MQRVVRLDAFRTWSFLQSMVHASAADASPWWVPFLLDPALMLSVPENKF